MTDTANREESTHEYRHIEYRHSASQRCGIRTRRNGTVRMSAHEPVVRSSASPGFKTISKQGA